MSKILFSCQSKILNLWMLDLRFIKSPFIQQVFLMQLWVLLLLGFLSNLNSQNILTEQDVIRATLKNSPVISSANLQLQMQRQLEGVSFNLANPEFIIESPTGEFMTLGVSQAFQFPSVYTKQRQLAKQHTKLAEKQKILSEREVIQQVKSAYLNLQFAKQLLQHLKKQDSIYAIISDAANRQFIAGQIDFKEKTFAASQFGDIHNQFMQAQTDAAIALMQLQIYTGIAEPFEILPLRKENSGVFINNEIVDSFQIHNSARVQYAFQSQAVAEKMISLEKSKALPGFSVGYMNQGLKNSEIPYRFKAGVNIPIWFWQYSASMKAAKTNLQISEQQILVEQQNLNIQIQLAKAEGLKAQIALEYFENKGLRHAFDLISTSERMFTAGQSDYINYLRTLSDAYKIQIQYLETLRKFNQAIININYLKG
ncbi:MAG: TolC family protein [Saprospiraceae bacterium]|nr:TolC family protein [Saprospiraceae bacterium]